MTTHAYGDAGYLRKGKKNEQKVRCGEESRYQQINDFLKRPLQGYETA